MTIVTGGLGGGPLVTSGYGGLLSQIIPHPIIPPMVSQGGGGTYYPPNMVDFDDGAFWEDFFGESKKEEDWSDLDDEFKFEKEPNPEKLKAVLLTRNREEQDTSERYKKLQEMENRVISKIKQARQNLWQDQERKEMELKNSLMIIRKEKQKVKNVLDIIKTEKASLKLMYNRIFTKTEELKEVRKKELERIEVEKVVQLRKLTNKQNEAVKLQRFKNMILIIVGGVVIGYILYKILNSTN